jgi:3D (Asp-Asp-Asp) domain-containing protein
MGKRLALTCAILLSVLSSTLGENAQQEPISREIERLYGQSTQAQEVSTAAPSILPIADDGTVKEKPVIATLAAAAAPKKAIAATVSAPQTRKIKQSLKVVATGYSSTPEETDSTPFVTASGTTVRDGVAAANFLPIGTKFMIPALYGEKVFTVEDRMNPRYDGQPIIDIWFANKGKAIDFGRRTLAIEVI